MKPVTIAGSTGFIGAHYCAMYPDETVALPSRFIPDPLYHDTLWLRSTTDNYSPTRGDFTTDIEVNLLHLVEGLKRARGTFNYVSSWFTVANAGQDRSHPAREGDLCDPRGFYSSTKTCAEHLVRSYCETFNIPYRILRLCNVIGNDPRASKEKNGLEYMLRQVVAGDEVKLYTQDCHRNVMHINDICRALYTCLDKAPLNEITHIGNMHSVRMIDLVYHAIAITGSKSIITLVPPPRFHQIVQVADFFFNTTKLRSLGFVSDMDPYQAVERVLANL